MRKFILIIFLFFMLYTALIAAGRRVVVDSVEINSDFLTIDFRAEGIIDDKIAEGLHKGRTSTLEYKIQLWSKKSGLLNQLMHEQFIRMKINYDYWENKFMILTHEEKRLTSSIETVREKCSEVLNYKIIPVEKLQADIKYSIAIEVILRPLSVENYQEIKRWLSGEVKEISLKKMVDPEKQERGFKNRMLRMFMAITGFGERVLATKTDAFMIVNNQIVWE